MWTISCHAAGSLLKCPGKVDVTSSSPKMPQASHGSVVYLWLNGKVHRDVMRRPSTDQEGRECFLRSWWILSWLTSDGFLSRCLTIFCIFLAWRQRHLICLMLRLLVKQDLKAWSIHLLNFNKRMYFQVLQKRPCNWWARLQLPNL